MACARVHTNDRWEEKLMDGCGLGSPAVCVVILLLGHCPPPRPPFCPPPCPTPPPPLSSSIFTSQLTSLSTSLSSPLTMDWNLLPFPSWSSGTFPDFLETTKLEVLQEEVTAVDNLPIGFPSWHQMSSDWLQSLFPAAAH